MVSILPHFLPPFKSPTSKTYHHTHEPSSSNSSNTASYNQHVHRIGPPRYRRPCQEHKVCKEHNCFTSKDIGHLAVEGLESCACQLGTRTHGGGGVSRNKRGDQGKMSRPLVYFCWDEEETVRSVYLACAVSGTEKPTMYAVPSQEISLSELNCLEMTGKDVATMIKSRLDKNTQRTNLQ